MAANAATLSFSLAATSLLNHNKPLLGCSRRCSKRFVSYPSFSRLVAAHTTSNSDFASAVAEQPRKKLGCPTEVYVCNLPRSCDTQHLLDLFTPHGTVLSAQVCRNPETGESKGSAIVTMVSYITAKSAVDALDGSDFGGREMRVNFSVHMNTKTKNLETLNSSPLRTLYYEGPHRVYVGNLAKSITPEDVKHLFGRCGSVASVRVLQDVKQGIRRVYAFVSYLSQRECDASLSLNGTILCGRAILVRETVKRTETLLELSDSA